MTDPMPTDPMLETLRARLGAQYAIDGLLGRGGMGSVFRARDLTLDRPVAIKVVTGDVATNPDLRARFLQEARTVAKLRHPNIVAVYSAGDADGMLYFAMELVPGESLRDLLDREKRVDGARAERILHELALALDYAHANGIVHRDVKPENILLDRETGRAMLTDFGVARALEGDGRMTGTGMILGSPRYMTSDGSGNLFLTDNGDHRIYRYNVATGYLDVFLGSGTAGYQDSPNPALAQLSRPRDITSDGTSVYWAEYNGFTLRQADLLTAGSSTLVGAPNTCGDVAGAGTNARMGKPFTTAFHFPTRSIFVMSSQANGDAAGTGECVGMTIPTRIWRVR